MPLVVRDQFRRRIPKSLAAGDERKVIGLLVGGVALPSTTIVVASRATLLAVPDWSGVRLHAVYLPHNWH